MRWPMLVTMVAGLHGVAACVRSSAATGGVVQILVDADGEAGQLSTTIALPIEHALLGLPQLARVQSSTVKQHVVVSADVLGDVLAARAEIIARLESVQLPEGVHPQLGPYTTPVAGSSATCCAPPRCRSPTCATSRTGPSARACSPRRASPTCRHAAARSA